VSSVIVSRTEPLGLNLEVEVGGTRLTRRSWKRYKFLGADLRIRKYYLRFQVFECICYFSAFFCAGFGIQVGHEYCLSFIMACNQLS
jgi:hypothetical protein